MDINGYRDVSEPNRLQAIVTFFQESVEDENATDGRKFKMVDMVKFRKAGTTNHETIYPIEGMAKSRPDKWELIEDHYLAWKEGKEIPEEGTPLVHVPFLNAAELQNLANFGCRTVEALAGWTESDCQKVLGSLKLRNHAKAYLEAQNGPAKISEELERTKELLAEERKERERLGEQVNELMAQIEALAPSEKRGPGRPRKTEE